jgi:hypothetical protein
VAVGFRVERGHPQALPGASGPPWRHRSLGGRNWAICSARLGGDGQAAVREVKVSEVKATRDRATGGRPWPRKAASRVERGHPSSLPGRGIPQEPRRSLGDEN